MNALSTSSNGTAKEWLPPSMALQRFTPPGDLLWNDAAPVVERKRYGYRLASLNLLVR